MAYKSLEMKGLSQKIWGTNRLLWRLLWHTNPEFYAIWAVFIGGGGGPQYIEHIIFSTEGPLGDTAASRISGASSHWRRWASHIAKSWRATPSAAHGSQVLVTCNTCHWARLGTSLAFYRGQKGLSLENPEKSLKTGSRGLSTLGLKKLEKESKTSEKPEKNLKNSHFRLLKTFSSFFDPGVERPREPVFGLFSGFSRERPFWPLQKANDVPKQGMCLRYIWNPCDREPQHEISKTLNSKLPSKYLTFNFGEIMFTFGEITFSF